MKVGFFTFGVVIDGMFTSYMKFDFDLSDQSENEPYDTNYCRQEAHATDSCGVPSF